MPKPKPEPKWKVEFLKNPKDLIVYSFGHLMQCISRRYKETFDIYARVDGEWIYCYHNELILHCRCGRDYNGFRFRASFMDNPRTLEDQLTWLKLPVLCMVCYYQGEILKGNWAPAEVHKELGLEK
jgi:hypothetical protein